MAAPASTSTTAAAAAAAAAGGAGRTFQLQGGPHEELVVGAGGVQDLPQHQRAGGLVAQAHPLQLCALCIADTMHVTTCQLLGPQLPAGPPRPASVSYLPGTAPSLLLHHQFTAVKPANNPKN
jgi:hypothetical protein